MKLYDYLISNYEPSKPILIDSIKIEGKTTNSIRVGMSRLLKKGLIRRNSQGIYYIPKEGVLGEIKPSYTDIVDIKYISNGKDVYGYYTGMYLENLLGLTTQVPMIRTIVTNNETNRLRKVKINGVSLILKKSIIEINKDNNTYLQLLDLLNNINYDSIKDNEEKLIEYIDKNKLDLKELNRLAVYYPNKTLKRLMEVENAII